MEVYLQPFITSAPDAGVFGFTTWSLFQWGRAKSTHWVKYRVCPGAGLVTLESVTRSLLWLILLILRMGCVTGWANRKVCHRNVVVDLSLCIEMCLAACHCDLSLCLSSGTFWHLKFSAPYSHVRSGSCSQCYVWIVKIGQLGRDTSVSRAKKLLRDQRPRRYEGDHNFGNLVVGNYTVYLLLAYLFLLFFELPCYCIVEDVQ